MGYTGDDWLLQRVLFLIPVLLSLSVHEWAHAACAARLGDPTAESQGRLTLNPLAHIDPVGLLLPLLGVPFGWAKPVPIEPARMRHTTMRTGLVLTAAAGPISNLLIALGLTLGMALWARQAPGIAESGSPLFDLCRTAVFINLVLAVFNALPFPPLDGGRIVEGLCPDGLRPVWNRIAPLGPALLVALLVVPMLLGFTFLLAPVAGLDALLDAIFHPLSG